MRIKTHPFVNRLISLLFISLIVFVQSCTKSAPNNKSSSAITGFSFLSSVNPIPVDAIASINGTNISIFLPPGTNPNALIANFTLSDSNAIVRVNGTTQESGKTETNFSTPVSYEVTAPGGFTQNYTVSLTTDISSIDQNVTAFMNTYNVPGLSIAVTLNEKLVYAKGYGLADVGNNKAVGTQNLFRTAALSQQITSVALMRLMDQGKVNLSDKVFGTGAILGTEFGTLPYGPGITDITVGELLHHTEGGWANDSTDPMMVYPNLSAQQLISWTLDNRPLVSAPGNSFIYSNFGYCILGRVIEKITGSTYFQAVQSLVLQPCGITDMQIAGNSTADRIPNEVFYYGQSGENPYGFNIARMDAHSGWLATATDMARFLVHVDGVSDETILSQNALSVMTTGSVAKPNYACGWFLDGSTWYHPGGLPGSGTAQSRSIQYGNFNVVILTNTRSINPNFDHDKNQVIWSSIMGTSSWPNYDLFQAIPTKSVN
jgi:D-alanyl-D-alanine carboxypeptidase